MISVYPGGVNAPWRSPMLLEKAQMAQSWAAYAAGSFPQDWHVLMFHV
jgi:hypothetical protein